MIKEEDKLQLNPDICNELALRSATEVDLVLNKYPLFINRISRRIADNIKEIMFKKEGEKKIKKYGIGYIKVSMKNWLLNDWITPEVEKAILRK